MESSAVGSSWLFVHSSDELYGADRVLLYMVAALPDDVRAASRVWLPSDLSHGQFPLCERLETLGIRVDHVPLPILRRANLTPAGLATISRRAAAFRSHTAQVEPDVIYGTTSATLPALAAARSLGAQLVLHNQEVWKPKEAVVLGELARSADRIIAVSRASKESMPAYLQERAVVVSNTTPDQQLLSDFVPLADLPLEPMRFLAAGRWTANKGFDVLLRAWSQSAPGVLTIVGGPPPTGDSVDLVGLMQALPNMESVTLAGEVDSINSLIWDSHVVVMPSTWPEPFGLVALEAMAAGRPVVASKVGGLEEFVIPDVGWLVPASDPTALAQALAAVSPEQIIERGSLARAHYVANYGPDRFAENWRTAVGFDPA